ncbi:uncharacterized protein (DUF736 family) [Palleronia aestuarii]|uniref:Uncharacterized protein (DUF736 family) n=1 Tax=Palleronia aestuarii TaxID=568105 RepID=A0A2W7N7R7_9RHOB|nr:DUF736 family protein [Palleronia aestuarii]PZX14237.1 uncharacterized protein (DUF736 family) [Palleronia aestuarii]
MITGTLTQNADARSFTATISTMMFDIARIAVVANPYKTADNHPDFQLEVRTPRGRTMRVGSMWKAVSEKSGRAYFSLAITDRMGRTWRMNAVRNEETPEGTWQIVPMTGGKSEQIALTGQLELLDDDNFAGFIGGYDFDMDFTAVENPHKTDPSHPDYHIEARSPAGVLIRMGSIWKARSERTGTAYLSIAFASPRGSQHRANAFRREDAEPGVYEIVALTGPDLAVVA